MKINSAVLPLKNTQTVIAKKEAVLLDDSQNTDVEKSVELVLSDEAQLKIQQDKEKYEQEVKQKEAQLERLQQDMEASKKQAAAMQETMSILIKCMKISARIISGNNVPYSDHAFLQSNEPEMYSMAISVRRTKENPQDLESVSEEDKNTDEISAAESTGENESQENAIQTEPTE